MKRFLGYHLFSDVDGTILDNSYALPERNVIALKEFVAEGGSFSLATGRGIHKSTRALLSLLPVNAPCLLLNGSYIYDFETEQALFERKLPEHAKKLVRWIENNLPDARMSLWTADDRYEIGHESHEPISGGLATEAVLSGGWNKILLHCDPRKQAAWVEALNAQDLTGMAITLSCDHMIEIMPDQISKGTAIEWMIAHQKLDRSKVLVTGDYYNDREMLSVKGIRAFCPANAPNDIKTLCEAVFCPVEEGMMGDLLTYLRGE